MKSEFTISVRLARGTTNNVDHGFRLRWGGYRGLAPLAEMFQHKVRVRVALQLTVGQSVSSSWLLSRGVLPDERTGPSCNRS
jgi:hypothetical protein